MHDIWNRDLFLCIIFIRQSKNRSVYTNYRKGRNYKIVRSTMGNKIGKKITNGR